MDPADAGGPGDIAQARTGAPYGIGALRTRAGTGIEIRAASRGKENRIVSNHKDNSQSLGDFTATPRLVPLSLLAIGIGILSTFVAWLYLG